MSFFSEEADRYSGPLLKRKSTKEVLIVAGSKSFTNFQLKN